MHGERFGVRECAEIVDVGARGNEQVAGRVRELVHDDQRVLVLVDDQLRLGLTEDAAVELVGVLHVLEAPGRPQGLRHRPSVTTLRREMTSETTRHEDGTVDIVQRAPATAQAAEEQLERLYWSALRRATFGVARFERNAVRVAGLWPALLRFGPMAGGVRPIVGGMFARRPHGSIRWEANGSEVVVAVERFAPLLRGPLWRFESWFHDVVGRRFLQSAARGG